MNRNKGRPIRYKEPKVRLHPLAHQLRKRRYDLGITAEEVAARIGCSLKTLQERERGDAFATVHSLMQWAKALGWELTFKERQ